MRPAARVRALSTTASPSQYPRGCTWFGGSVLPMIALTSAGMPEMLSVCRMCVYSWVSELGVPVVVVAESARGRRARSTKRRMVLYGTAIGRAVGVVGVVGEDDLGEARHLPSERAREPVVDAFGDRSDPLGYRLEPLVIVDAKMRRLDRPPLEIGIARGLCGRTEPQQRGYDDTKKEEARGPYASSDQVHAQGAARQKESGTTEGASRFYRSS